VETRAVYRVLQQFLDIGQRMWMKGIKSNETSTSKFSDNYTSPYT
jgi:hypothetical protein